MPKRTLRQLLCQLIECGFVYTDVKSLPSRLAILSGVELDSSILLKCIFWNSGLAGTI